MKTLKSLLLVLAALSPTYAQKFVAEAKLPKVETDGFYRILLEPGITRYLNNDLSNIRIFDNDNKETAYFLKFDVPYTYTTTFKEYTITDTQIIKDSATIIVISNPQHKTLDNISLIIKNARVTKSASLYGSDDKREWFILRDELYLSNIENPAATSEIKIVDFPLSDYNYYQLRIDDRSNGPLNIVKAGYYSNGREDGSYLEVPAVSVTQSEILKDKTSHIRIKFDTAQFIDRVQWRVTGQKLYKRNATAYAVEERETRKGKKVQYVDHLSSFDIQTGEPCLFQIPGKKIKELLVVIENNDNQPLKLQEVEAFQLKRYATVWLEKARAYTIKVGDASMAAPVYDIAYFQDSIPVNSAIIKAGSMTLAESENTAPSTSFFTSKWFIWIALIIVIGFLAAMSIRMVRETSPAEKS